MDLPDDTTRAPLAARRWNSVLRPRPELLQRPLDRRQLWAATRFWMETENIKSRRYGGKSHHHWRALSSAIGVFAWGLKRVGGWERGRRNALDLHTRRLEQPLAALPRAFDGFSLLQLSDLHIDGMPGLERAVIEALDGETVDLCVITGDFRREVHGPISPAIEGVERLVEGISSRLGFVGVLGNHDSCHMVEPLERAGVRMLINETLLLERDGERLALIGVDDPHWYYTEQTVLALEDARNHRCTVALVHSPEIHDLAAEQGVDLYLCGHTHAGQICLPGGRPLITHLTRGRRLYRDQWSDGRMRGFTHAGTGTSGIPIRFNTRGEVVIHRLRSAS